MLEAPPGQAAAPSSYARHVQTGVVSSMCSSERRFATSDDRQPSRLNLRTAPSRWRLLTTCSANSRLCVAHVQPAALTRNRGIGRCSTSRHEAYLRHNREASVDDQPAQSANQFDSGCRDRTQLGPETEAALERRGYAPSSNKLRPERPNSTGAGLPRASDTGGSLAPEREEMGSIRPWILTNFFRTETRASRTYSTTLNSLPRLPQVAQLGARSG